MASITPRVRVPARAAPGEVLRIRTLLTHPMETGRRRGPDGAAVPRWIVTRFTAAFEGEIVLDVEIEPAIAPNPFFEFTARVEASGAFTFTWTDDAGAVYTEAASIVVG